MRPYLAPSCHGQPYCTPAFATPTPIAYPIGAPWSVGSPGRGPPLGELSTVAYLGFRLCHLFFCWGFYTLAGPSVLVQGPAVRALEGTKGQKGAFGPRRRA